MEIKILFFIFYTLLLITIINGKKPDKVVGGTIAHIENYPFQVSVQYLSNHFCGGYILTKSHISTSASCVLADIGVSYAGLKVLAGTADHKNSFGRGTFHEVRRIIFHPEYDPQTFSNDLAILTLSSLMTFNPNCQPAFMDTTTPYGNTNVKSLLCLVGYNIVSSRPTTVFKKLDLTLFKSQLCSHYYEFLSLLHICALPVRLGSTITMGDGGSPVVLFRKVIGIVSVLPIHLRHPFVMTGLYHYRTWIKDMITAF